MTKVLVTGGGGQLAKTIKELFFRNNDAINFLVVDRKELDITNRPKVDSFFKTNKFDYCINCAAYTNVELAETESVKAYETNAEGVKNLAEACKTTETILIHISTDYVFDGKNNEPYTELDTPNPINEYGKSKLLGETYINNILNDFFIIRTSWLYSRFEKNFFTTIINKIKENSKLKVTTSQKGTPTSCEELSKFIYFLIKSKENNYGIYHFSPLGEATWYDFALQIANRFNKYDILNITPVSSFNSQAKRPEYSVLSKTKTQSIYPKLKDWKQVVDFTSIDLN